MKIIKLKVKRSYGKEMTNDFIIVNQQVRAITYQIQKKCTITKKAIQ